LIFEPEVDQFVEPFELLKALGKERIVGLPRSSSEADIFDKR
jgi:hypothetical protein